MASSIFMVISFSISSDDTPGWTVMMTAMLKLILGMNSRGMSTRAIIPRKIIDTIKILAVTGLLTEVFARFMGMTYCIFVWNDECLEVYYKSKRYLMLYTA